MCAGMAPTSTCRSRRRGSPTVSGRDTSWRSLWTTPRILRRAFSIRSASTKAGGALQIIVSPKGPGTKWLVARRPGDVINVIAPLGQPFRLPTEPVPCVLVGGGYGVAPLFELASQLRARGCSVDIVVGAGDAARLHGVVEARRVSDAVHVTTDDGSAGEKGRVTDPLERIPAAGKHMAVYACGPDGNAAGGLGGQRESRCSGPVRGGGVNGLWRRGVHDVRAACHRRRRRDPHGALVHRRAGVLRRPGPMV